MVRRDGLEDSAVEDLGFWTWKARILSIFMHEFMGVHEIFFCAEYFEQVPSSEGSNSAKQSELSFMRVLKLKSRQHFGDDTRLVNMLLHRFMIHPIANRKDAVLAHEFCDLDVRSHLQSKGHRSILPPWPEVGKLYWFEEKAGSGSFKIGVVRRVTMLEHLKTEEES